MDVIIQNYFFISMHTQHLRYLTFNYNVQNYCKQYRWIRLQLNPKHIQTALIYCEFCKVL